jgi:hypothetical protein
LRRYYAPVSVAFLILAAASAFVNLQGTYSGAPPILDPNFRLWTNSSKGSQPLVWVSESVKGSKDQVTFNQSRINGKDAVELRIFQSGISARPVIQSLSQTIDGGRLSTLLNVSLGIWILKEPCHCDLNPFNKTSVMLAVEVNDGIHTISFLFTDELQGTQTLLGHKFIFMPTPSGAWTYQRFTVGREYALSRWPLPDRISFSIVLGVGGAAVGWHHAYLNAVTTISNGLQNPLMPTIISQIPSAQEFSRPKINV